MNEVARKKVKSRVNRIGGQVAGVGRMIDEERYCVEILNQIAAARSALDSLGLELLKHHLEGCVLGHGSGSEHRKAKPMKQEELLAEVQTVLAKFLK